MNRIGRRDELDGVLLFLAGLASSFVTGQTIAVDGGVSAAVSGPQYDAELFASRRPSSPTVWASAFCPHSSAGTEHTERGASRRRQGDVRAASARPRRRYGAAPTVTLPPVV